MTVATSASGGCRAVEGEACDLTGGPGEVTACPAVGEKVSLKVSHSVLTAEDVKGLQVAL